MANKTGRGVQSIEVGGRLLQVLAKAKVPLMLRELAGHASLTPGQAHAYLVSFRALGLVEQEPSTQRYQLGPFALTLGLARLRRSESLQIVWNAVPKLAETVRLMVTMSIWSECGPIILRLHEAEYQIYSNIRSGARYALTTTATGRLFAALMPPGCVEPLVKAELRQARRTDQDVPTLLQYLQMLEPIRREMCSVTEGSPVPDISAIAVPIFDLNDQLVAAITLIGRRGVLECQPGGRHRCAVTEFASDLSAQLGYGGLGRSTRCQGDVAVSARRSITARRE